MKMAHHSGLHFWVFESFFLAKRVAFIMKPWQKTSSQQKTKLQPLLF